MNIVHPLHPIHWTTLKHKKSAANSISKSMKYATMSILVLKEKDEVKVLMEKYGEEKVLKE